MRRAILLSRKGYPAPNPHVGCVIVKNGVLVGEGHHQAAGMPHAEAVALAQAGADAKGAEVYVTLEPCAHFGRTPPCADALVTAGVRRVTYAVADPNPRGAGGAEVLRAAGIEVGSGLITEEACKANRRWLEAYRLGRPFVVAKAAVTAEGFIARPDGTSKWITGPEARREGRRLRAELGAVVVGFRTALLDDPSLTPRLPGVVNAPLRLVFDPKRELPGNLKLFKGESAAIRIVGSEFAREGDLCGDPMNLELLLHELWDRGVRGLLVEGGARTLTQFFEADFVDEIALFVSPQRFGKGLHWAMERDIGLPEIPELEGGADSKWTLHARKTLGQDVFWNYLRSKRTD